MTPALLLLAALLAQADTESPPPPPEAPAAQPATAPEPAQPAPEAPEPRTGSRVHRALMQNAPASTAQPAPPPAGEPPLRLPITATLGLVNQLATHRSYDLVSENDALPMVRIAAGYALDLRASKLDLELGFQSGGSSAVVHNVRDAGLWLRGLDVGATYRHALFKYLHPYARLAAGYDWATLTVGEQLQRTSRPSLTGMAGLGVPVVMIDRGGEPHALFVLDFGLGYTLRQSFVFDALEPEPPARPAPDAIGRVPLDLGRMQLSGITWRLGLTFRL
ncbi:MAG: hypothetical protein ACK4N5_16625 [Myxococcales bacterium]